MTYNLIEVLKYLETHSRSFHVDNVKRVTRHDIYRNGTSSYSTIYIVECINGVMHVGWVHDGNFTPYTFYGVRVRETLAKKLLLEMRLSIEQVKEIIEVNSTDELMAMIREVSK